MIEQAGGVGFVEEELAKLAAIGGFFGELRVGDFDRHQPVGEWIVGRVNCAHAAAGETLYEFVLADFFCEH